MTSAEILSKNIFAARIALGLSKRELAEKAGVDEELMSDITDKSQIEIGDIDKIAKAIGVPESVLRLSQLDLRAMNYMQLQNVDAKNFARSGEMFIDSSLGKIKLPPIHPAIVKEITDELSSRDRSSVERAIISGSIYPNYCGIVDPIVSVCAAIGTIQWPGDGIRTATIYGISIYQIQQFDEDSERSDDTPDSDEDGYW